MKYGIGLGLFLLSFFQNFSTAPWRAAHSEIFAFMAVLLWGWGVVRNKAIQIHSNPPVNALLCLALLIGVQYFSGHISFGGDAITMLVYIQLCITTLLIGQFHANDPDWSIALALALLLAALGSAVIALAQALWVWNDSGWISLSAEYRRPGANFGQANHLATLLLMGVVSLIYLSQRLKISHIVWVFLGFLLLLGIAISESRTGLISGMALSLWWLKSRRIFTSTPRGFWIAVSFLVLIIFMWIWPHLIIFIHEAQYENSNAGLNTKVGTRSLVWSQLWEAVWIKPWLGWGLRGVSFALDSILEKYTESEPFTYAHNIIIDMAIGMGLPLSMLAVIFSVNWGCSRLKINHTPETWYAVGLLIPFFFHSMLEYPFAYAYFLVPTMLAIAIIEKNHSMVIKKNVPLKIFMGNLITFTVLLFAISVEYLKVEEDFRVARFEALNVGVTPVDYDSPNIIFLTQLAALLDATRIIPHPNMTFDEIFLLKITASRFVWVPIQNSYALSAALNGDVPEAQRQLKVMRAMHGEKKYLDIRMQWDAWARQKYPQLRAVMQP